MGSNNAPNGYSVQFQAAFPYLTAANTNQQPQQPGQIQTIPGGGQAQGAETAVGVSAEQSTFGTGVEPNGKSVTPAQYGTDLASNPNALFVSRAPAII